MSGGMKWILIRMIMLYRRWISPGLPGACRFEPTCSAYALDAIERKGAIKGIFLTIVRLLKCHPFHPGGYDPVPESKGNSRFYIPNYKTQRKDRNG